MNTDLCYAISGDVMFDFTFLTEEQCYGENKLDILKKLGVKAPITDFAILLGGNVDNYSNNGNLLEYRAGSYWTSTFTKQQSAYYVDESGSRHEDSRIARNIGSRVVFSYSLIRNKLSDVDKENDGIIEFEYGEYPQKIVSKEMKRKLERAIKYNLSSIKKTGKTYTTDSRIIYEYDKRFREKKVDEYIFSNGKKYIRIEIDSHYTGHPFKFSNNEIYYTGDYVWIEVQPIKWLVDEKSNIVLSEKVLFAGIQFSSKWDISNKWENGTDFRTTNIKKFMDTYFSKDIIPSQPLSYLDRIRTNELKDELILMTENYKKAVQHNTYESTSLTTQQSETSRKIKILKIEKYNSDIRKMNKDNIETILLASTFALSSMCAYVAGSNSMTMILSSLPAIFGLPKLVLKMVNSILKRIIIQEKKNDLISEVGEYDLKEENPNRVSLDNLIDSIENNSYIATYNINKSTKGSTLRGLKILKIDKYQKDTNELNSKLKNNLETLRISYPAVVALILGLGGSVAPFITGLIGSGSLLLMLSTYRTLSKKAKLKTKLEDLMSEVGNYELPSGTMSYDDLIDNLGNYDVEGKEKSI